MKTNRFSGLLCLALGIMAPGVYAQNYPNKPIRLLVPFAPGGSTDVAARILGVPVGQALGQNIVIDNRPAPAA